MKNAARKLGASLAVLGALGCDVIEDAITDKNPDLSVVSDPKEPTDTESPLKIAEIYVLQKTTQDEIAVVLLAEDGKAVAGLEDVRLITRRGNGEFSLDTVEIPDSMGDGVSYITEHVQVDELEGDEVVGVYLEINGELVDLVETVVRSGGITPTPKIEPEE